MLALLLLLLLRLLLFFLFFYVKKKTKKFSKISLFSPRETQQKQRRFLLQNISFSNHIEIHDDMSTTITIKRAEDLPAAFQSAFFRRSTTTTSGGFRCVRVVFSCVSLLLFLFAFFFREQRLTR